jgi:large subunit ribosomal protein L41
VKYFFFKLKYLKLKYKLFFRYNKRGSRVFKKERHISNPDLPIDKRGVRDVGITFNGRFQKISEMIPQLIVPDLTNCHFKPYVTYKTTDVIQGEFRAQDLFNATYAVKIIDDFKNDNLNEDGSPKTPSVEEEMTPDEAWIRARKTGSDIF